MIIEPNSPCPCGKTDNETAVSYGKCCQPYHLGTELASSPELLMRSRYSAFVAHQYRYLIRTHHADFCQGLTEQDLVQEPEHQWLSLQVLSSSESGVHGVVHFQAWYRDQTGVAAINERSQFLQVDGHWLYTEGEQFKAEFPKRNQPCICNSGKKFKQCCLK